MRKNVNRHSCAFFLVEIAKRGLLNFEHGPISSVSGTEKSDAVRNFGVGNYGGGFALRARLDRCDDVDLRGTR
jgi:hypothetical protein